MNAAQHLDRMDMLFQLIGGLPPADFARGEPACDDPGASVAERRELAELFFPVSERDTDRIEAAKALCRICPVRAACLEHAQRTGEDVGIWGGLTASERRELRAARTAGEAAEFSALGDVDDEGEDGPGEVAA